MGEVVKHVLMYKKVTNSNSFSFFYTFTAYTVHCTVPFDFVFSHSTVGCFMVRYIIILKYSIIVALFSLLYLSVGRPTAVPGSMD